MLGTILRKCMQEFGVCRSTLVLFLTLSFWGSINAALAGSVQLGERTHNDNFDLGSQPTCRLRFSGEIMPGDAQLLEIGGFDSNGYFNVCLDSSGGKLTEALAMSRVDIPTTVLPGMRCESACAIAFLGGSFFTGNGVPSRVPSRSIWPDAKLGFHAPNLELPEDRLFDGRLVTKAFDSAVSAAAQTFELTRYTHNQPTVLMNDYLFMRFLSTPSKEMYYIKTVGDALFSEIEVKGIDYSKRNDKDSARSACINAYLMGASGIDPRPWFGKQDELAVANYNYKHFEEVHSSDFADQKLPEVKEIRELSADKFAAIVGPFVNLGSSFYEPNYCIISIDRTLLASATDALYMPDENEILDLRWWIDHQVEKLQFPDLLEFFSDNDLRGVRYAGAANSMSLLSIFDFRTPIENLPNSPNLLRWKKSHPDWNKASGARSPEYNLSRGYDISGFDVGSVDDVQYPVQCLDICRNTNDCNAAVYNRWHKVCFLKSILKPTSATAHFAADLFVTREDKPAVKYSKFPTKFSILEGFLVNGIGQRTSANDLSLCQKRCRNSDKCRAFSFEYQSDNNRPICRIYTVTYGITQDFNSVEKKSVSGLVEK